MARLLLVDDQPNDVRLASQLAQSVGFSTIEVRYSAAAAKVLLENALDGKGPLPDAILLDLDLGYESGFEVIRFWHAHPRLSSIALIVWANPGEDRREICRLFKVTAFLSKHDDIGMLRDALSGLELEKP